MAAPPVGNRMRAPLRAAVSALAVLALTAVAGASYTVQPGDTLSGIAARHGVSIGSLAEANGIADRDFIVSGTALDIPGSSGGGDGGGGGGTAMVVHTVASGETLSSIAARYGASPRSIANANDLGSIHAIVAGQELEVPGGAAVRDAVQATPKSTSDSVESLLTDTAQRYGFNPAYVKAIAYQESGWNPDVVSSAGAIGVMQVMPETGEWVSSYLVGRPLDLRDPADNIEAGVAFMDYLWGLTGGDAKLTLAGYYQGLASVEDNGRYDDTRQYIRNVLALRNDFA